MTSVLEQAPVVVDGRDVLRIYFQRLAVSGFRVSGFEIRFQVVPFSVLYNLLSCSFLTSLQPLKLFLSRVGFRAQVLGFRI